MPQVSYFVLSWRTDAMYGQSEEADLRVYGPFASFADADEWIDQQADEDTREYTPLPLPIMSEKHTWTLRPIAPGVFKL